MTRLAEFLFPAPARRDLGSILRWWERRRPAYNLIVGTAGLLSIGTVSVVSALPPGGHGLGLPAAVVLVVGVLANVCYFLGPATEYAIQRLSRGTVLPTGPALYRMGLTFSLGLVLLPTLVGGLEWGFRVLRWIIG